MVRLFSHYISSRAVVSVTFEALLILVAMLLALRTPVSGISVEPFQAVALALLPTTAMVIAIGAFGLYDGEHTCHLTSVIARLVLVFLVVAPALSWILCSLSVHSACGPTFWIATLPAFLGIAAYRVLLTVSPTHRHTRRRVLVIGTGEEAAAVEHTLKENAHAAAIVVGYFPLPTMEPRSIPYARIVSPRPSLLHAAKLLRIDEVIVAVKERRGGLSQDALLECRLSGIQITDLLTFYERTTAQLVVELMQPSWLVFGEGFRQSVFRMAFKRVSDVVASLILLIVATPIMLLAAFAIAIEDGRPIFYRQERVGLGGKRFNVIKFRSMRTDAEGDGTARWAQANDTRITHVGQILRRSRIDELPQILNVLLGDMSIVGPRPERPVFVEQLAEQIPYYVARHSVKPGITGWAQVKYKYGTTIEDSRKKLQFDLYYVKNHTLFLDLLILWRTVWVVLARKGAH